MDSTPPEDPYRYHDGGRLASEQRLVRYHSFVGEATFLLPVGTAFFGGILLFLGPFVTSRAGIAMTGGLPGVFGFAGSHRVALLLALVALNIAVPLWLRTASVRDQFNRSDLLPLFGKLVLFLPLLGGLALLLGSILTPLTVALSTVP